MENVSVDTVAALGGLAGGIVLGFAARWGRFCTLNAIEDAVLGGNSNGLRMWGLSVAIAIFGTYALSYFELIDISNSFYISSPPAIAASIFGGVLFGLGMALVGTCGFGTLARMGGGDLKSVVTFLIFGISAYATMSGATAYIRVALFDTPSQVEEIASIPHWLARQTSMDVHHWAWIISVCIAIVCLASPAFRAVPKNIVVSLLVGVTIVWGWVVTGILVSDPFHPYPLENFTFSGPTGDTIIYFMTMSGASLKFGIGAVAGVVVGATVTSVSLKQFRWEACDDAREMRRQIFGGALMGFGGVTAVGCTVGQGISAASVLAWSAPITLLSIFAGAWIGLQYLINGSISEPLKELFSYPEK